MRFARVLVAIDQSAIAAHAFEVGVTLAGAIGADVGLVHVLDPRLVASAEAGSPAEALRSEYERGGRDLLQTAAVRVRTGEAPWQFTPWGAPAEEIVAAAREWQADLIVLGTHGRSGVGRLLMGSTAEGVLRHAPCPVLAVPARANAPRAELTGPGAGALAQASA